MLPQRSHITRKRGVYYYRRRLPSRWGGEVALSLRTSNFRRAEWSAQRLDAAFEHMCRTMPSQPNIQKLAVDYLRRALDHDMQFRVQANNRSLYGVQYGDETPEEADAEFIAAELKNAKRELTNRRYDSQRPLIDQIAEEHSVPAERLNELAHAVLQARVQYWETLLKRTRGEFTVSDGQGTAASAPPAKPSHPGSGLRLSEVLPDYVTFMVERKGWRGQTKAQSEATFRMFIEHCGDKPVPSYTRQDLTGFYDLLRQLPALYSKKPEWKSLPLAEVVERTKDQPCERMTMKTVKRHFSALGAVFTYLKKRGDFTGDNPAHGFDFPEKVKANEKRKMWQGEQLKKLFSSPVWAGCASKSHRSKPGSLIIKDEKYWLPLLALYHGNRLEEFAQLHLGDVRQEGSIRYFDINDEGAKQLKNDQSKRRVPIHPSVIDAGFLDYVATLGSDPVKPLFPELKPGGPDNKLGYHFTKWFSRYRQDVGIYEKGLDYHSFRHGVITKLYAAEVPEPIIDELTGHEGGGIGRQVYKKAMPLDRLLSAISKVSWPEVEVH